MCVRAYIYIYSFSCLVLSIMHDKVADKAEAYNVVQILSFHG